MDDTLPKTDSYDSLADTVLSTMRKNPRYKDVMWCWDQNKERVLLLLRDHYNPEEMPIWVNYELFERSMMEIMIKCLFDCATWMQTITMKNSLSISRRMLGLPYQATINLGAVACGIFFSAIWV
jgi:hypothetical protein